MTQLKKIRKADCKIFTITIMLVFVCNLKCRSTKSISEKDYYIAAKSVIRAFENKDYFNSFIVYSDSNIDSTNYFDQVRLVNLFSDSMKSSKRRGMYTKINVDNRKIHRFDFLGFNEQKKTYLKEELEFEEKENLILLNYIFIKIITKEEGQKYISDYAEFEFSKTDEEGIQNYFKQLNLSIKARNLQINKISKNNKENQNLNVIPITPKSYLQIKRKDNLLNVTGFKDNKLTKKIKIENCNAIDKIVVSNALINFFEFK